ncbi:MAG: hypothetical protein AAFN68_11125, partial [Pseudomonadota bacterium]
MTQIQGWIAGPADDFPVHDSGLNTIAAGRWTKIHQMHANDITAFPRQVHSGSAFDQKRNRLLIFGSDTHGRDWDNSVRAFDLDTLSWSSLSDQQPFSNYIVTAEGVPGALADKHLFPWAMHAFDAINYDPVADRLVVASKPEHLKPGRFKSPISNSLWDRALSHPTWSFDFTTERWETLVTDKAVHLFPYASAYSREHHAIFGFRPDGVFKLSLTLPSWNKVARSSINAYHTQAVWDSDNQAFVIAGSHDLSNTIHIYRPGEDKTIEMPTSGKRPPGFEHTPMAYYESNGMVAFVIDVRQDGEDLAETWLYNLKQDKWKQLWGAEFPFHLGMNYHMQYSS